MKFLNDLSQGLFHLYNFLFRNTLKNIFGDFLIYFENLLNHRICLFRQHKPLDPPVIRIILLWSSVFVTLVAKKYRFMQFELDMVFDTH